MLEISPMLSECKHHYLAQAIRCTKQILSHSNKLSCSLYSWSETLLVCSILCNPRGRRIMAGGV